MKTAVLKRGRERPMDPYVTHNGREVWRINRGQFSIDALLEFLGRHAASLYEKEVLTPADYEYMSIDVKGWDIYEGSLIMPVYVKDQEERRYVYTLSANSDAISMVAQAFNECTGQPRYQGMPLEAIQISGCLVFTRPDDVFTALCRISKPFSFTKAYYVANGQARYIGTDKGARHAQIRAGGIIMDQVQRMVRGRWESSAGNGPMSTVIEIRHLDDAIAKNNTYETVPKPDGCTSLSWTVHVFLGGGHACTYMFRTETVEVLHL